MCFSASASFGAGIVLSAIGIASIRKTEVKSRMYFAVIPFLFAVQQFSEGFLWLALSYPGFAAFRWPATYVFLFFAQVVWPFWVPFSIREPEEKTWRKTSLTLVFAIGVLVSSYLAYCLLFYPVEAKIVGMHISYLQDYPPALSRYGGLLYVIVTIAPPFLSGFKRMWLLGTAVFISYIITTIFYKDYIVSVWCFFASVISIAVLAVLYKMKKPTAA